MGKTEKKQGELSIKLADAAEIKHALDELGKINMDATPSYELGMIANKVKSINNDYQDALRKFRKANGKYYVTLNGEKYYQDESGVFKNEKGEVKKFSDLENLEIKYELNEGLSPDAISEKLKELGAKEEKISRAAVSLSALVLTVNEKAVPVTLRPEILAPLAGNIIVE